MSFFGLNSSEQQNITENNISSAVTNSSSNISSNIITNSEYTWANVDFENIAPGEIKGGCDIIIDALAQSNIQSSVTIVNKTDTNYDTTLTNNITNTLKNKVKQKTPGLFQAGLFSSQVNNQLNKAVNNTKNEVANKFYINRKNQVSNDATTKGQVHFKNTGIIDCSKEGEIKLSADAFGAIQSNFISKTMDSATAKSKLSTTFTNDFANTASQTGGSALGGIITVIVILFAVVGGGAKKSKGDGGDEDVEMWVKILIILFLGVLMGVGTVVKILMDDSYYEMDTSDPVCDDNYDIKPEFDEDDPDYNKELVDACAKKRTDLDNWKQIRMGSNFSSTDDTSTVTVTTGAGTGVTSGTTASVISDTQYTRVDNAVSLRGTIKEIDNTGSSVDVDYTRLNIDPYSDIDCGHDGLDPLTKTLIDGCRTIEADFKWEQLIKNSCGCCKCDPSKIGYHNEWVADGGAECYLDNSRKIGVHCDKNIDIIQPGSGYETGQNYETKCRNKDGEQCKKDANGVIVDLEDGDQENIKVSLISETDCHGENDSLVEGGQCTANLGTGATTDHSGANEAQETGCCYKEVAGSTTWTSVTDALFGKNSGVSCDMSSAGAGWTGSVTTAIGVCPPNCMKGDSCRINYLNAMKEESTAATNHRDMNSQSAFCPSACFYKVHGVQELRVTDVPEGHISSPDNIYTVVKKTDAPVTCNDPFSAVDGNPFSMKSAITEWQVAADAGGTAALPTSCTAQTIHPVENNGLNGADVDYIWQASSLIHFSNKGEASYDANSYTVKTDCDSIPEHLDFPDDNVYHPKLCDCTFRRLPSCIKDDTGHKTEMGCGDDPTAEEGNCLACIGKSGELRKNKYDTKLTEDGWYWIASILTIYIFISLIIILAF